MGNFQGDSRSGGFRGGNRGGKPDFKKKTWNNDRSGGRDGDRDNTMHKATCSECGKSCQVPFRPLGDKPVYCSNCFAAKREGGSDRGERSERGDFSERRPRREFADRRPEPHFHEKPMPAHDGEAKKQLEEMNRKLDRLIDAVEKLVQMKKEPAVVKPLPEPEIPLAEKPKKASAKTATKAVAKKKK